ncbi:MAG: phosphatidylglycerophosphatase A [Paracoccaceae bacterium]|jgi:phosphatidylglycerophosphatase A
MNRMIATWFGVGYMRPAPGTWGSLVGLVMGVAIDYYLGFFAFLAAFFVITILGFWSCSSAVKGHQNKDPSEFVIDEVAGQFLALLLPAAAFYSKGILNWAEVAYPAWIAAFVFFRLFDIWKPWLVGRADRRGDPAGIMLDDLWAGLFAGLAVMASAALIHGLVM